MSGIKELIEFLGFTNITDNQPISKEQYDSLKPFFDSYFISTYSGNKSICAKICKLLDGHIIARINLDEEAITISLRSTILDALNLAAQLADQAN